ncbi:hypothetical protein D9V84_09005 [Bacteroidetes/Chlorobi group bacterium Naka2016]|jgi:hypothetical protein|nr:MAG: hypothetical protein D9V84_09005 [Bacteroidetes/Chlorobi group bacterium Naka2016]
MSKVQSGREGSMQWSGFISNPQQKARISRFQRNGFSFEFLFDNNIMREQEVAFFLGHKTF